MQQEIYGLCCHFIYLIKDEVVDKVSKKLKTPIEHTHTTQTNIKDNVS
jgi:hypothetical protein